MSPAVSGITIERNASISSRKLSATTTAIVRIEPAARSRRRGRRSRRSCRRRRRSCSCPSSPSGSCRRAGAATRSLGRPVGGRGRRRHVQHRRGARRVDERLGDRLDAGGLLEVVAQVLQARVGRRLLELLALVVGLLLDLVDLLVELRLDLRLRLRCAWPAARPAPRAARRSAAPAASAFSLALSFWSCSCWSSLSSFAWSAFAGCLDMSTLISSGPLVPAPKPVVSPS